MISLTPLIDVVFILLIFFMLASSFLNWRTIDLNAPGKATTSIGMQGALLVDVRPDGIRLAGQVLTLEDLAARVAERLKDQPDQRVLVKPVMGVVLQEAVTVLNRLFLIMPIFRHLNGASQDSPLSFYC